VPSEIGALIAARADLPVIGIGAGPATGGQVLVYHDLLGLGEGRVPRFVRRYAEARATLVDAVRRWAEDVRSGEFPSQDEGYGMPAEDLAEVRRRLGLI
jgi:3-methyl-2-oxobutanoate hydroxymethyltransferase